MWPNGLIEACLGVRCVWYVCVLAVSLEAPHYFLSQGIDGRRKDVSRSNGR